jgi:hypothetical protein
MQSLNDMARYQKAKLENDSSMNLFIYIHMYLFILYERTKLFVLEQKHQKDPLFHQLLQEWLQL